MCFRPSEIAGSLNCPNCGRRLNAVNDVFPEKCPFCKTELADAINALKNGGAPAAATPAVPGAPKAPGAPAAPKAPGAPVPPAPKAN